MHFTNVKAGGEYSSLGFKRLTESCHDLWIFHSERSHKHVNHLRRSISYSCAATSPNTRASVLTSFSGGHHCFSRAVLFTCIHQERRVELQPVGLSQWWGVFWGRGTNQKKNVFTGHMYK